MNLKYFIISCIHRFLLLFEISIYFYLVKTLSDYPSLKVWLTCIMKAIRYVIDYFLF